MFKRSPAFAAFCIFILGLGIGAVLSIFSVVNALMLKPLPYPNGDKIVRLMTKLPKLGLRNNVSGPNWQDWHDQSKSFAAMARFNGGELALTVNGKGIFSEVYWVSSEFLDVFETEPKIGRRMDENSVVISHGFWQQQFGGSTAALGQTVKINQRILTVAGVMPEGFQFPAKGNVWMLDDNTASRQNRSANNFRAVGRLKVPIETAQVEMDGIAKRLAAAYPETNRNRSVGLIGIQEQAATPYRETLYLLFAAGCLLLLIACANVSSLLLAQAQARQREFAVRASLGASSVRIVGQVVIESLGLGLSSALVGLLFASFALELVSTSMPTSMDWRVGLFATIAATISSLLFSVYPAWKVSRLDLTGALKSAGQKGMLGTGSGWFRRSLAIGQVAISLVMLCGSLLLVRSMTKLMTTNLGIDPQNVLVSYTHIPARNLEDHIAAAGTLQEMLRKLREAPQVESASAIMGMPTGKYGSNGAYVVGQDDWPKDNNQAPEAGFRINTPGFFATMRIPLLKGRDFSENDAYDKPFVAIINESLARRSFPNSDPIGQKILCGLDSPKPMIIVGVVGDVRHDGPAAENSAELYMPYKQHPFYANEMQIAIRTKGDPQPVSALVREIASKRDPDIAVNSITMNSMIEESVAAPRFRSQLLSVMAGLALVLAAAGLYGVLAYLVSQRLSEFGLRVALGANRIDIVKLVWRETSLILGLGFAIGLALVASLGVTVKKFLFGVEASDPMSIALAVGVLALAALVAAFVPMLGAAKADPLTVLRSE
jgi:putative ABC transport system permease protein